MRGWIYVMTNLAMPGLVKVGFSMKDPQIRAKELDVTGLPHRYKVAFDALIEEPRLVEMGVHRELKRFHEAKEFFRASVDVAVQAVERVLVQQGRSVLLTGSNYQKSSAVSSDSFVMKKAIGTRNPKQVEGWNGTAEFVGACGYCGCDFSVTLTRDEGTTVCPSCYKRNDVSEFVRIAFAK